MVMRGSSAAASKNAERRRKRDLAQPSTSDGIPPKKPACDHDVGPRAAAEQAVATADGEILPCGRPAAANHWLIVPIPRDGHCGYRAVLTDSPDDIVNDLAVRALRAEVAEYLASTPSAVQHEALEAAHVNLLGYLHGISPGSEYANGDDIYTMACVLQHRIILLEAAPDGTMTQILNAPPRPPSDDDGDSDDCDDDDVEPVFLLWQRETDSAGAHFQRVFYQPPAPQSCDIATRQAAAPPPCPEHGGREQAADVVAVVRSFLVGNHWSEFRGTATRAPHPRCKSKPWHVVFDDGDTAWWSNNQTRQAAARRNKLDADAAQARDAEPTARVSKQGTAATPAAKRYRAVPTDSDDSGSDASDVGLLSDTDSEGTLDPLGQVDETLLQDDIRAFYHDLDKAANMLVCSSCGETDGENAFHPDGFDAAHVVLAPLDEDLAVPDAALHRVCTPCFNTLSRGQRPCNAVRIPPPSPLFQGLSDLDLAIVRVLAPVCSIKVLPHGGAHGFTGHSVIYTNDVVNVVAQLPRDPAKAGIMYAVRRSAGTGLSQRVPFHPDRIREILPQLIAGHPAYTGITIDESQLNKLCSESVPPPLEMSDSDDSSDDDDPGTDTEPHERQPRRTELVLSNDDKMAHAIEHTLHETADPPVALDQVRPRFPWEARLQSIMPYPEFYLKTFPHYFSELLVVPSNLSELDFVRHLMRLHGSLFAKDEEFIAVAYARLRRQRAGGICWKACGGSDTKPTKELLQHTCAVAKGDAEITKDALDTLRCLQPFAESLPGTPLYMAKKRSDALAWIKSGVGIPFGLFVTLGNGGTFWEHPYRMLGMDPTAMTRAERETVKRQNPVTFTKHFHDRRDAFKRRILNGKAKPLGHITDSLERDDATQRGDLHCHMMLAVRELGNRSRQELLHKDDWPAFASRIGGVVNATMTPPVAGFHTFGRPLRAGEPQPRADWPANHRMRPDDAEHPSRRTPPDAPLSSPAGRAHLGALQRGPNTHFHWPPTCFPPGSRKCRLRAPWSTSDTTHVTCRRAANGTATPLAGLSLVPQRDHVWLAAHTPALLQAWNANTNTQVIADAAGCCRYALKVAGYATKHNDPERPALSAALKRSLSRLDADASASRRLSAVLNAVLGTETIPITQAVDTLMHTQKPVRLSRMVVSLNISRNKRASVVPKLFCIAKPEDANFYADPLLLRAYWAATSGLEGKDHRNVPWREMPLAHFAKWHFVRKAGDLPLQHNPRILNPRILNGKYAIGSHRRRAVLRTHPYVTADTKDETTAYAYLTLYYPHSSYEELERLIDEHGSTVAALEACWDDLAPEGRKAHARLVELAKEQMHRPAPEASDDEEDDHDEEAEDVAVHEPLVLEGEGEEDDAAPMEPDPLALPPAAPALSSTFASSGVLHVARTTYRQLEKFIGTEAAHLRQQREEELASMGGPDGARAMTDGRFEAQLAHMVSQLDEQQRRAYRFWTERTGVASWPPTEDTLTCCICMGGAGTGKSRLLEAMKMFIQVQYAAHDAALVTTYTNRAACNINGFTLHRAFSLFNWQKKRARTEAMHVNLLNRFKVTRAILIDEVGNVPAELVPDIDDELRWTFKDDPVRSRLPFAGIPVAMFGDFLQLPPVNKKEFLAIAPEPLPRGHRIWREKFEFFTELVRNHRQANDVPFHDMLERLRYALAPLQTDVDALNSRVTTLAAVRDVADDTLYMATRWRDVDALNSEDLTWRVQVGATGVNMHARHFDTFESNKRRHRRLRSHALHDDDDEPTAALASMRTGSVADARRRLALMRIDPTRVGGVAGAKRCHKKKTFGARLPPLVTAAIGSRMRITLRIHDQDGADLGLVPNTFGIVESFVYDDAHGPVSPAASVNDAAFSEQQLALPIVMLRIHASQYKGRDVYGRTLPNGERPEWLTVPIAPVECNIQGPDGHDCVRQQLPLELAQAMTVHSAQGTTADSVVLVVSDHPSDFAFAPQSLYSACTRARTLAGLHILAPHPFTQQYWTRLFTQHREHVLRVLAEYDRLRNLPDWTPTGRDTDDEELPDAS